MVLIKKFYCAISFIICLLNFILSTAQISAFSVDVTTYPNGPIYKAGTEYSVFCSVASEDYSYYSYYDYEWSRGCSYTNQFTSFNPSSDIIGEYSTTPVTCQNVYRCRVTDEYYDTAIGEVTIETVTGTDTMDRINLPILFIVHIFSIRYCNSDFVESNFSLSGSKC